jgi:hypothetical protein
MWACFTVGDKIHVAPVDDQDHTDHILSMECKCNPWIDEVSPWVVVHEEIN